METQPKSQCREHTCHRCGKTERSSNWYPSFAQLLFQKKVCFQCQFWLEKIDIKDQSRVVRIENWHYLIGDEGRAFPGFNGRKFEIKFHDGREVATTNLWCQGEIPESFRAELPNNAVFKR